LIFYHLLLTFEHKESQLAGKQKNSKKPNDTPARRQYKLEKRAEKNKERRAKRQAKLEAKHKAKKERRNADD